MLITLCVVLFLDGLDVSMIGVALPSIGAELDLSTSTLQWLVSGYVLGYGGLLLRADEPPTCSAAAGCSSSRSQCSPWPRSPAAW